MAKKGKFRISGKFDKVQEQVATVLVDKDADLFSVKPLYRRRDFCLPLSVVAEIVVSRVIRAELLEKKKQKALKKKGKLK